MRLTIVGQSTHKHKRTICVHCYWYTFRLAFRFHFMFYVFVPCTFCFYYVLFSFSYKFRRSWKRPRAACTHIHKRTQKSLPYNNVRLVTSLRREKNPIHRKSLKINKNSMKWIYQQYDFDRKNETTNNKKYCEKWWRFIKLKSRTKSWLTFCVIENCIKCVAIAIYECVSGSKRQMQKIPTHIHAHTNSQYISFSIGCKRVCNSWYKKNSECNSMKCKAKVER